MEARSSKLDLKSVVAIGVGGMVGGGIFSVLGLAMNISGHAAPVVFALGGGVAALTGMSYSRLGTAFRSDGGSFTYLEHAFNNKNIGGIGGWLLVGGYIGTLALYAFTFGAYGSAMLGGSSHGPAMAHALESIVLLVFMAINLYGVRAAGSTELLIVITKVAILMVFAVAGLFYVQHDYVLPVFDKGAMSAVIAASLIFVAYEGFELIPNSVDEMEDPDKNLGRGIMLAILIATAIYILVSFVATGNLTPADVAKYEEYALAVAARPFLGQGGFLLIGIAALLSTASAINATLFGTARLSKVMAQDDELPRVFSFRERRADIPWASLVLITAITLVFVNLAHLEMISSFASATFLAIFASINLSAFRLRKRIGAGVAAPVIGFLLTLASLVTLLVHLYQTDSKSLLAVAGLALATVVAELLFSERRLFSR